MRPYLLGGHSIYAAVITQTLLRMPHMSLPKLFTAAVVAASLTVSSVAPASAGMVPTPTSSSSNNAEKALISFALIGLIAWITKDSKKSSGAKVTRDGGNTTGSFTLLKF